MAPALCRSIVAPVLAPRQPHTLTRKRFRGVGRADRVEKSSQQIDRACPQQPEQHQGQGRSRQLEQTTARSREGD